MTVDKTLAVGLVSCIIKIQVHTKIFKNYVTFQIQEIVRSIINLYEMWKSYDEKKEIQSLLGKMPKPNPAPQR